MTCKSPARPLALFCAMLLASIGFALGAARAAHAALPADDPNQISFTLEGCRPSSPFVFTGNNLCADGDYTSGNLVYQLYKRLSIGAEVLYGLKQVKSGNTGDDIRFQLGVVYSVFD